MKKEVKIGITGIIALVVLFLGINFLKGKNLFSSTSTYYIKFTNANGEKHLTGTISFDAKTNDELEKITGYMYSNYRIKVTASISDTAYSSYDWVVWTNARINAQYVSPVSP